MSARVIGVDPGLNGALAFLEGDRLMEVIDMPVAGGVDPHTLSDILAAWGSVDRVIVERQQAMPRQGVASTFRTGVGYGLILGVCAALERPVIEVAPGTWTRSLGVGADKGQHRRRAMNLFPAHADRFSKVKNDGRADAALIAYWGARQRQESAA